MCCIQLYYLKWLLSLILLIILRRNVISRASSLHAMLQVDLDPDFNVQLNNPQNTFINVKV